MSREVLQIGFREIGGTRIVRLTGELDSYTRDRLDAISETWIQDAKRVVLNLDDLEYIDSAGLSALVWMWVQARDRGGELTISCGNPRIYRILEITGLLKLFTLESNAAAKTAVTSKLQKTVFAPTKGTAADVSGQLGTVHQPRRGS
jgi:anti-anti-sigma factor